MEGESNFATREEDAKRLRNIMDTLGGKFRKKPIIVRAFLNNARPMNIWTLEGIMTCNVGDWLIEGVNGEFYPCKPDIFEKTYEEVE